MADEVFGFVDKVAIADEEGSALVQGGGLDIEDRLVSIGGVAPGAASDKCQGSRFVGQAQLAGRLGWVVSIGGVIEDAAREQCAVQVADQRADIAVREGFLLAFIALQPAGELHHTWAPVGFIAMVDGVVFGWGGNAKIGMGKQELADHGVEGKAVDARTTGVDQHGARAIDHVTGDDQVLARLKAILHGSGSIAGQAAVDGEDGADGGVVIDVGGAIQGVVEKDVLADGEAGGDGDEVLVLLGGHDGDAPGVVVEAENGLVGQLVELHDRLALDVDVLGGAQDLRQPSTGGLAGDELARQGQVIQDIGEDAGGLGVDLLLLEDVALDGDDLGLVEADISHTSSSMVWKENIYAHATPSGQRA